MKVDTEVMCLRCAGPPLLAVQGAERWRIDVWERNDGGEQLLQLDRWDCSRPLGDGVDGSWHVLADVQCAASLRGVDCTVHGGNFFGPTAAGGFVQPISTRCPRCALVVTLRASPMTLPTLVATHEVQGDPYAPRHDPRCGRLVALERPLVAPLPVAPHCRQSWRRMRLWSHPTLGTRRRRAAALAYFAAKGEAFAATLNALGSARIVTRA